MKELQNKFLELSNNILDFVHENKIMQFRNKIYIVCSTVPTIFFRKPKEPAK